MKQWNDVSQNKKLRDIFIIGNAIWKKTSSPVYRFYGIFYLAFSISEARTKEKKNTFLQYNENQVIRELLVLIETKNFKMEVGMVGNEDLSSIDANGNGESLGTHEAWVENGIFSKSFIEHLKQNIETMGWMD